MGLFDKNFKEIILTQLVCRIGALIGGTILAACTNKLLLIPGMLILLPGFLEMRGNISGTFASRISAGLLLGEINPKKMNNRIIAGNLIASFILVVIVSLALGFVSFLFTWIVFKQIEYHIIIMALIAALIANCIEISLTLIATFYLYRKGHDPNNIMGPFITTTGDVTSILSLLIALVIV
jgi:mgtE-like transporter